MDVCEWWNTLLKSARIQRTRTELFYFDSFMCVINCEIREHRLTMKMCMMIITSTVSPYSFAFIVGTRIEMRRKEKDH